VTYTHPNNVLFECNRCGLCCGDTPKKTRHILLLSKEANRISKETSLPTQEFSKTITGKTPYCYEMKKTHEGKCFFLKDNQCSIYESRPLICIFYPFELKFSEDNGQYTFDFTLECPGVGKGKIYAQIDFEKLFLLAQEKLG
jgi:Fe-S-cluster containining protein